MGIQITNPKKAEIVRVKGCDVTIGDTIFNESFGPMIVTLGPPLGHIMAIVLASGTRVPLQPGSYYNVIECQMTYEFARKEKNCPDLCDCNKCGV